MGEATQALGAASEAAVGAVAKAIEWHPIAAAELLSLAHDPALGLDRSVRLGDIIDAMNARHSAVISATATAIAHEFGGPNG